MEFPLKIMWKACSTPWNEQILRERKGRQILRGLLGERSRFERTKEWIVRHMLVFQIATAMKQQEICEVEMARRMETCRALNSEFIQMTPVL